MCHYSIFNSSGTTLTGLTKAATKHTYTYVYVACRRVTMIILLYMGIIHEQLIIFSIKFVLFFLSILSVFEYATHVITRVHIVKPRRVNNTFKQWIFLSSKNAKTRDFSQALGAFFEKNLRTKKQKPTVIARYTL